MKKLSALLFLALLLCALLVSCGGEATVIEIDATNADLFNEDFDVTARSYIKIVNMDPTNLIAVRSSSDSRDVSRDSVKSNGVIKSGDCNYIPIPDKSNSSHFSGRDVDIRGNGQVVFVKLHSGEGPMILSEAEDPISYYDSNGNRVYEKFFHVDFTRPPYDKIDRSRIALLTYNLGSGGGRNFNWGYVTNGSGGMKPESNRGGLYDFSEFDYINLYMTNAILFSDGNMASELILMNPVTCPEGVEVELVEKLGVYSFVPSNPNKQYVMEFNSDHVSENFNMRLLDGIFVGFPMKVYEETNRSVYYIGTLDSELLVDLYDCGTVKFREATQTEIDSYRSHFIPVDSQHAVISHRFEVGSDDEYLFFVDGGDEGISNSIVTLEFKYDDGSYVSDFCRGYFQSGHSYEVGTSSRGVEGAFTKTTIRNHDILKVVTLDVSYDRTQAITATVTIDRSDDLLTDKIMPDAWELYIAPNSNQGVTLVKRPHDGSYTVPNLKWTGHTFRGLMYSGTLYQPGESFEIEGPCTCAVGVWD